MDGRAGCGCFPARRLRLFACCLADPSCLVTRSLLILVGGLLVAWMSGPALTPTSTSTAWAQPTTEADTLRTPWPQPMGMNLFGPDDVDLDTVTARSHDAGHLWTVDDLPVELLERRYDFPIDDTWRNLAQQGLLRLGDCAASFASEQGLVLTTQSCLRETTSAMRDTAWADGFYASTLEGERPLDGLYADRMVEVTDVTEAVEEALSDAETLVERAEARAEAKSAAADRLVDTREDVTHAEVVARHGASYVAYGYFRYEDLRLAFASEPALRAVPNVRDAATYPRSLLDMALLRVYDDKGEPLEPPHHFGWARDGSLPGDPVFALQHPAPTHRSATSAQLAFQRDVDLRAQMHVHEARRDSLASATASENADPRVRRVYDDAQSAQHATAGRVHALQEGYVMARREAAEQALQDSLTDADAEDFGGLVDSMAALQAERRELAPTHRAFVGIDEAATSTPVLRRALLAAAWSERVGDGADADALAELEGDLEAIEDWPAELERPLLADRLYRVARELGADDWPAADTLDADAAAALASELLAESVLATAASTADAVADGSLDNADPAVDVARAFYGAYRDYQSRWTSLDAREKALTSQLEELRRAGTEGPRSPDGTGTPRISDGLVLPFSYDGTRAPPYTTFYGLYSTPTGSVLEAGSLPERWAPMPGDLDASTPLSLVSTNDVAGGASGAPLLNRNLEVVGLVADRNVQGLAGDYLYMPDEAMRAVSVDVRGMRHALRTVYDAQRLYLELTGGPFVESDDAAAAVPDRFQSR